MHDLTPIWPHDHGCETCNYLDRWFPDYAPTGARTIQRYRDTQTHHVIHGKTRIDVKANRVRICQLCHTWFHSSRKHHGVVTCLHRIASRGDWDASVYELGLGVPSIYGYLESIRHRLCPFTEGLMEELCGTEAALETSEVLL